MCYNPITNHDLKTLFSQTRKELTFNCYVMETSLIINIHSRYKEIHPLLCNDTMISITILNVSNINKYFHVNNKIV